MKLFKGISLRRKKERLCTPLELLFLAFIFSEFKEEINKQIQEMIEKGELKVKKCQNK